MKESYVSLRSLYVCLAFGVYRSPESVFYPPGYFMNFLLEEHGFYLQCRSCQSLVIYSELQVSLPIYVTPMHDMFYFLFRTYLLFYMKGSKGLAKHVQCLEKGKEWI